MEENRKISIKEIHATLWRCRDFEIGHLWQRSIFLTAFLISCFTAYGAILSKIIENLNEPPKFIILSIVAFVISIVGSVFSVLWIKMGKGSKAWYEVYERAISAMEQDTQYTEEIVSKIAGFNYTGMDEYKAPPQENSIFSNKGGAYSVSRINIGIGQFFYFLWLIIGLIHLVWGSIIFSSESNNCSSGVIIVVVGIVLLFVANLIFIHPRMFKSQTLSDFSS
jgi:bacitracin transport system permease protein